jgi:hypothetical protein
MNKQLIALILSCFLFVGCSQQESQSELFYEALTKAAVEQKMAQEAVQQPFTETNIPPSTKPHTATPAAAPTSTEISPETYALYKKITGHEARHQKMIKRVVKIQPNPLGINLPTPVSSPQLTPLFVPTPVPNAVIAWCCTQQEAAVKAFVAAPGFFIKLIISLLVMLFFLAFIFGPPMVEKLLNREKKNGNKNK